MKKSFKFENLDCANCAAKMEDLISKIDGVESASVSFLYQKLTITAAEEDFAEILKKAQKVCKKIESGCKIIF